MDLLCTTHDPEGRLIRLLGHAEAAAALFPRAFVTVTRGSDGVGRALRRRGFRVLRGGTFGESRVLLMKKVRGAVFYCDLDKLIHWQQKNPAELRAIARLRIRGFVLLERTPEAFATYPASWRLTETRANRIAARALGRPRVDVYSGSFLADARARAFLSRAAREPGWSACAELPLLAKRGGFRVSYRSFHGLGWEDPDRFSEEIRREGFAAWKKRAYDSRAEWQKRRESSEDSIRVIRGFLGGR